MRIRQVRSREGSSSSKRHESENRVLHDIYMVGSDGTAWGSLDSRRVDVSGEGRPRLPSLICRSILSADSPPHAPFPYLTCVVRISPVIRKLLGACSKVRSRGYQQHIMSSVGRYLVRVGMEREKPRR